MVVAEFEKLHYGGKEIPGISTPLPVAEAKEGDALPSFVPILGSKAASVWNGKILWLARGTRPDLAFAAQRIGRRISTWVRADDAVLFRIMRYLKNTANLGLVFMASPSDAGSLFVSVYADSDHCGEISDTVSTSGYATFARAEATWCALDWGAKRQGSTSRNTTEAEITASADGLFKSGLPVVTFVEVLLGRPSVCVLHQDNSGAVADIRKGYSRRMAHVVRHQRCSIGALHEELIERPGGALEQIPSKKQLADVLTKALAHELHWPLIQQIGLWLGGAQPWG